MEFENDIFISYAHIDNETMTEEQKGWISAFHQALEVRLAQLLGIRRTDPFDFGNLVAHVDPPSSLSAWSRPLPAARARRAWRR